MLLRVLTVLLAAPVQALSLSAPTAAAPALRALPPRRCSEPFASESLAVTASKAAIGIAAQPVLWASLFTLRTTGCGLPDDSLVQAFEGLAYLVVAAFAVGSLVTRATTGGGGLCEAELASVEVEAADFEAMTAAANRAAKEAPPEGRPAALRAASVAEQRQRASLDKAASLPSVLPLLRTAERLSLASAAAGLAVVALQLRDVGSVPSALPVAGAACWTV